MCVCDGILSFLVLFSVVLSSAELWYDCVFGSDDLEGSDGVHW